MISSGLTLCNNCAGKIVLSLNEHVVSKGLNFCCEQCAETFHSRLSDDPESFPCGLAYDLGLEEGGY